MPRTKNALKLSRQRTWNWFLQYRKGCKCSVCGESHWAVLDFHHIDPKTKKYGVPTIACKGSLSQLQREIDKCIVLCSNCHRKLHVSDPKLISVVLNKSKFDDPQINFLEDLE